MKILIPLDGSTAALDALHFALRLVRQGLHAQFVLANVQEPASLYEMVVAHDAQVLERVSREAAAHLLAPGRDLARAEGLVFETEIASGDPAHTLADIVERRACDAVIMAARGAGGAAIGAVAQAVLEVVAVPVTIVKPAAEL